MYCFKDTYHTFLHHIFTVCTHDKVQMCTASDNFFISVYKNFLGSMVSRLCYFHKLFICHVSVLPH